MTGHIFSCITLTVLWEYAYDIDIISRFPKSLLEATVALDRAARRMGLEINQAENKYMICGTKKKYFENVFEGQTCDL
jgi:hypothetical protein